MLQYIESTQIISSVMATKKVQPIQRIALKTIGRGRRIRTLNKGFGDPRVTITPCPYAGLPCERIILYRNMIFLSTHFFPSKRYFSTGGLSPSLDHRQNTVCISQTPSFDQKPKKRSGTDRSLFHTG